MKRFLHLLFFASLTILGYTGQALISSSRLLAQDDLKSPVCNCNESTPCAAGAACAVDCTKYGSYNGVCAVSGLAD
jgi:hypothetical protein